MLHHNRQCIRRRIENAEFQNNSFRRLRNCPTREEFKDCRIHFIWLQYHKTSADTQNSDINPVVYLSDQRPKRSWCKFETRMKGPPRTCSSKEEEARGNPFLGDANLHLARRFIEDEVLKSI
eukprot:COSAG02_NODE_1495_length_12314_cov_33.691691_1_plen_121_part_10